MSDTTKDMKNLPLAVRDELILAGNVADLRPKLAAMASQREVRALYRGPQAPKDLA